MLGTMEAQAAAQPLTGEQLQITRICLGILGVLGMGSLLSLGLFGVITAYYPLLLVAMSPLGRWIVLVAPRVDPIALLCVVVVRRMLFYQTSFFLGRALGPPGVAWIEARAARFGRFVRFVERAFKLTPHLVILLLAGPTTSTLAGMSGMRTWLFTLLAVVSTTARVAALVLFADWVSEYVELALAWLDTYWLPTTVVSVGLVALYRWRRRPADSLAVE